MRFHVGKPAAWIEATGEDVFPFLQGQFSNDLRTGADRAVYGLWLNRKGRVLADSLVFQGGTGQYLLFSPFSFAQSILDRLEAYIIADDVDLRDQTSAATMISVWGEEWKRGLRSLGLSIPEEGHVTLDGPTVVLHGRISRKGGLEIVCAGPGHGERARAVAARLLSRGAEEVPAEEVHSERIASGFPAVPLDVGPEDLPQEGGLDKEAVSFSKGCFLGQEVMARLRAMGQVRRALVPVLVDSSTPPAYKAPVFFEEKPVGELRSMAGQSPFQGFAMIHRNALAANNRFSLKADGDPVVLVIPHRNLD